MGKVKGGGTRQRYGIKRYKLLGMKQIGNKDVLYSVGNYSQYFVISFNGVYKNTESLCYTPETNIIL